MVVPLMEKLESNTLNEGDVKYVTSILQVLISIMQEAVFLSQCPHEFGDCL